MNTTTVQDDITLANLGSVGAVMRLVEEVDTNDAVVRVKLLEDSEDLDKGTEGVLIRNALHNDSQSIAVASDARVLANDGSNTFDVCNETAAGFAWCEGWDYVELDKLEFISINYRANID